MRALISPAAPVRRAFINLAGPILRSYLPTREIGETHNAAFPASEVAEQPTWSRSSRHCPPERGEYHSLDISPLPR
jgi:hypothetical protein